MNENHLAQAVGFLDDALIAEYDGYRAVKRADGSVRRSWRPVSAYWRGQAGGF